MRFLLLAAFAALTLAVAVTSSAMAATSGLPNSSTGQSGPYDNTGRGPNESGLEGGGG
jgi:hypothetical protein